MKKLLLAALLTACGTCIAQTPAAHTLPDGSTDMYFGAGVIEGPDYEGSSQNSTRWALTFQAQFSNGIFISNSKLGMHLSDNPAIEYGPLLVIENNRPKDAPPRTDGLGGTYPWPGVGGFFNYNLPFGLQLASDLLLSTGRYHGDTVFDLDARLHSKIANHHTLSYWTGLTWTNASAEQTAYGININQPENLEVTGAGSIAANSPTPPTTYTSRSGIQDVHAGINWNWDLSSDWLISTRLYGTHLLLNTTDNLYIEKRNNVTISTALAYRF